MIGPLDIHGPLFEFAELPKTRTDKEILQSIRTLTQFGCG